jgi:hypothetical protein
MKYTTQKVLQTKYTVIIVFKAAQKSKKKLLKKKSPVSECFVGVTSVILSLFLL